MSPAAIRRHLDALVADNLLTECDPRPRPRRGRGRPARAYALTDAGRAAFPHAYDDLATTALRYLRETGGEAAVAEFATHRARTLEAAVAATMPVGTGAAGRERRVAALAVALTGQGYAASTEHAGAGVQLCQHHCPVAHVAAEFPQLCEAETRAFERVLGTYVQRLATIAHGDGVCTTLRPRTTEHVHNRHDTVPIREDYLMTTAPERVLTQDEQIDALGRYGFGWADTDVAGASAQRGLSEAVVRDISAKKNEPDWMLRRRLRALAIFEKKPMPNWGSDLVRDRLRQHQVLRPLDREAGRQLGRAARRHQEHLRQARHPGGGEAAPHRRRGRAV